MNHRVGPLNQVPRAIVITEAAFDPGDRAPRQRCGKVTQVARRAVPAEELVPRAARCATRYRPRKPVAPVTAIFIGRLSSSPGITLNSSTAT